MKKILIIGAGGLAREIRWLIEEINEVNRQFEFIGYIVSDLNSLKDTDSKELVLVLEVDTSHAESLLSSFTDWEDVKLEKDLVERDRYIVARK